MTFRVALANLRFPESPERSVELAVAAVRAYGQEDLLVADLDLAAATGLLASRCKA